MKRKRNNKTQRTIQALVLGSAAAANAAPIPDDVFGNVNVPPGVIDGTVVADGGTSTTPFVNIDPAAVITGDAGLQDGVQILAVNYTVNNNGTITVVDEGVNATGFDLVLNNNNGATSAISGGNTGVLLGGAGSSSILNTGSIIGGTTGIVHTGTGTLVLNSSGLISGGTTAIDGGTGSDILNLNAGSQVSGNIVTDLGSDQINLAADSGLNSLLTGNIDAGGDSDSINVTATGGFFTSASTVLNGNIDGGLGADSINVQSSGSTIGTGSVTVNGNITGGGEGDTISILANGTSSVVVNGNVTAVSGTNFITISSNGPGGGVAATVNGNVTGGADNDNIFVLSANGGVTTVNGAINHGLGSNSLVLSALSGGTTLVNGTIAGGDGADNYSLTADNGQLVVSDTIFGSDGNDLYTITAQNSGSVTTNGGFVSTGDQDDTITIGSNSLGQIAINSLINAGTGNDVISVSSDFSTTVLDDGIFAEAGNDTIILSAINQGSTTSNGNLDGGDGDDTFSLIKGGGINQLEVFGDVIGGAGVNTLTFDGGLSVLGNGFNAVHGNVTGMQSITKIGGGTAFVGTPGDGIFNVTADTIDVNAGGLYLNANVAGNTVAASTINANGTALGGTGTWTSAVNINSGGFSAGAIPIQLDVPATNAIGTLNVVGNVTHAIGTFIRYDVRPQASTPVTGGTDGDLIVHTGGTYDLGASSALRISATNVNQVLSDGVYTVVNSDAAITGTPPSSLVMQFNNNIFDTGESIGSETDNALSSNTVLTQYFIPFGAELTDGGTNLSFEIIHDYEGLPGLTDNQSALGGAIDASINNPDPDIQDFIAALDYSDLDTVQETLAALSPDAYFGLTTAVVNSNYRIHRMVQEHLAMVRSGGQVVAAPATTDAKGNTVQSGPVGCGGRGNVWGSISYDWQEGEGSEDSVEYDGETGAFTAGADWRVSPTFVIGGLLDGSTGDFDFDGGGGSDIDSFRVALYGTWGESLGLYSDFLVGWGDHDLDLNRRLGGVLAGRDSASTNADSLQALWTIGYAMGDETFKHGPFAGLEYQNVEVDGFDSSGPLPLALDDFDVDSLRGLIGYRVNSCNGIWRPYASVAYAHEFEDDSINSNAVFGDVSFRANGPELGSAVIVTAGTGVILTDCLTLDVGYRGDISVDSDGVTSHGANLGLNWAF